MVKCELCGRELNSEAGLIQHYKVKHRGEPLPDLPTKEAESANKDERIPKEGGGRRRKKELERKRGRILVLGVALFLVVGGGLVVSGAYNAISYPAAPFGSLPFPCANSTALHVHPSLSIVIQGSNVTIPADIGIVNGGGCLEPMHTHDTFGIIHLEAPSIGTQYTLGDFFQIWKSTYGSVSINGVNHPIVFNSTDILGFKADQTHQVILLVDGKPASAWGTLDLNQLNYCGASTIGPPCAPPGTAGSDPYFNGQPYPYGTGHTIVVEYQSK